MTKLIKYLILFMLLTISIVIAGDESEQPKIEDHFLIKTESDAIKRALEYTGFNEINNYDKSKSIEKIELIVAQDSTTPFITNHIEGRIAWSISFKNLDIISFKKTCESDSAYKIKTDVVIDAENGELLQINSYINSFGINSTLITPNEGEMNTFFEKYYGIPNELPLITLHQVLEIINYDSIDQEIVFLANYFYYSKGTNSNESNKKPVWIVRIIKLHNLNNPSQIRYVIDAINGEIIFNVEMEVN
ncbi:MAG: hypothetical protein ABIJ12_07210 [bacterium]